MKNAKFLLFIALITLTGCSLFRKTTKDRSLIKTDSTSQVRSTYHKIDTGTVITIKKIDTVVNIPGVKVDKYFPLKPGTIFPGFSQSINDLDTAMLDLKISYDSLHHAIRLTGQKKPEAVPIQQSTQTITKNGLSESGSTGSKTQVKHKDETEQTTTTPDYGGIFWKAGICLIVAGITLYWLLRKKRDADV